MCDETKSAFLPKFSTQTHCRSNGDGRKESFKGFKKKKRREIAAPAGRDVGIAVVYESCEAGECLLNTFSKKGESGG